MLILKFVMLFDVLKFIRLEKFKSMEIFTFLADFFHVTGFFFALERHFVAKNDLKKRSSDIFTQ